ncbi:tonsoku-like protein isoform X1 [Lytechinus variegatus]|uniref:tonsoku-like protein isoform X1 n=1 Tax=Lytechinus variegatus TaxID=7654 RepID=UPI001BB0FC1A|nr:tonsoku-like protein isoform X1 [Lytechinus variegatus]
MNNAEKKEFKRLQKCKLKAQTGGNLKEESELSNLIGELLARSGDYHEAIKEHRNELQLSESLHDVIGAAVANRKIGECFNELCEYEKALKHQRKHLQLAELDDNILEQQRALATVGRTYLCWADNPGTEAAKKTEVLQEAQKAFLRSLSLCDDVALRSKTTERELMEMKARLLLNLGLVHESLGSGKNAAHFIQKAIFIAEKHKLLEDLFRCHLSLGDVFQRSGVYTKAGRSMENALMVAKKMKSKELESQCLCASANVFFQLGDFTAAKRSLKKAYKLGGQQSDERENIIRILQIAIRCVNLQVKLEGLSSNDQESQFPILEALGDLCCKVDSFKRAIEFYKKQLHCAKELGKSLKEQASIYVSLAATYADNSQFREAIEMYNEELKLRRGNLKEETKTWLNVADMQEKAGESLEVIQESYSKALELAKKADHPQLQIQALRSQLGVLQKHNIEHLLRPTQKMLKNLREEHDIASDDDQEVSDDDQGDSQKEDSEQLGQSLDIVLDDLSESDSGSDEEYDRPSASERVRRNKFSKLNEKGESLLHRACIAGNLKQVKKLIEQGHPLNPRDYCGWTPLHEACNYGYSDIVDILLTSGADINDRGGDRCEGVTPLHDAVNCGNWPVARLLIERGANTDARDDSGKTPLDALKIWLETYTNEIDTDTREECFLVARMLREGIKTGNRSNNVQTSKKASAESLFLNSDVFDREEGSSQASQQKMFETSRKVSPSQRHGRDSQYMLGKKRKHVPHKEREEGKRLEGRSVGVASRRNAAMSLGSDSEDGSDTTDDVELMSEGEDEDMTDRKGHRDKSVRQRRYDDEDSLPEIDLGANMGNVGRVSPLTKENNDKHGSSEKVSVKDTRLRTNTVSDVYESDEDDIPASYLHIDRSVNIDSASTARKTYKDVMQGVGSAATRMTETPFEVSKGRRSDINSALVPEESYTGGDDWLVEDVPPQSRKRQRVDIDGTFRNMSSDRSERLSLDLTVPTSEQRPSSSQASSKSSRSLSRKSKPKQAKLTNLGVSVERTASARSLSESSLLQTAFDSTDDDFVIEDIPTQTQSSRTVTPTGSYQPSSTSPNMANEQRPLLPGPSSMMRVQVKIQDKLLLIPVNLRDRPSMQWLSEQAASRYYSQCGLRPKLSLCTPEGALFSPEDSVVDLLNNNEMVVGRVDSWDLPPLTERYRKSCERTKTEENTTLVQRLQSYQSQQSQHNATLDLSNLYIHPTPLLPLMSALQCQYSLRVLLLPGNRLDDDCSSQLAAALKTLPNLTRVDLSCCGLTYEGLRSIADVLDGPRGPAGDGFGAMMGGSKPLQLLEELDLSYNYLTDSSALSLAMIVKHCPLLTTMSLRSCDLTAKFFQLHRHKLVEAFQGALSLHTLLISHNMLGSTGVELLLGCLSTKVLQHLDLSNVISSRSDGIHIARHLVKYFSEEPVLDNLHLSGCYLSDVDVDCLKRLQPSTKHWKNLNLSANPRLSSIAVSDLLLSMVNDSISISRLDLSGCLIQSPLDTLLLDAFTKLLPDPSHVKGHEMDDPRAGLAELRLCGTELNKVDKEILMNVWNVAHGMQAGHHIDAKRCIFFRTIS